MAAAGGLSEAARQQGLPQALPSSEPHAWPDADGVLPLRVGSIVVHSLGTISNDDGYHSSRAIFPVGYCVTRQLPAADGSLSDEVSGGLWALGPSPS